MSVKTTHELAKALLEKEDLPFMIVCPDKIRGTSHITIEVGLSTMSWCKNEMYIGYDLEDTLKRHGFRVERIEEL